MVLSLTSSWNVEEMVFSLKTQLQMTQEQDLEKVGILNTDDRVFLLPFMLG